MAEAVNAGKTERHKCEHCKLYKLEYIRMYPQFNFYCREVRVPSIRGEDRYCQRLHASVVNDHDIGILEMTPITCARCGFVATSLTWPNSARESFINHSDVCPNKDK